eukprot:NODE_2468_length_564_cov_110.508009_g2418_i0.p1 GENE.NODE_2468_length_564_cov_110.508009_g2418_i0~~NODE_2468_length_564_cov_110.508009_g2418_i0.p1  ORF type:complete len:156 (+),score=24.27 NODE_2468_length_564_cov_110.508009_g2418_i0:74-541(+)
MPVGPEVFSLPAFGTMAIIWGYVDSIKQVGEARKKYKINVPATSGDPNFERAFRAQQNNLEWLPIILANVWTPNVVLAGSSDRVRLLTALLSTLIAMYYAMSRNAYSKGYAQAAEKRSAGFYASLRAVKAGFGLTLGSILYGLYQVTTHIMANGV